MMLDGFEDEYLECDGANKQYGTQQMDDDEQFV